MSEPHDVRGHFPYHEYEHPTDHDHPPLKRRTPAQEAAWHEGYDYGLKIDAARAPLDVDVMTLRRALERGLAAVDDEWTIEELAELAAREYAALATPEEGT